MGKNKKYKRLAKRIKGHCLSKGYKCGNCKYDNNVLDYCACICANSRLNESPYGTGIREIERICKYGR